MERYARFFERRWRWIAAFGCLMTVAALFGWSRLEFDDVPRGILRGEGETYRRLQTYYEDFGSDDNDALIVLEARDWLTADGIRVLRGFVERLRSVEGVTRVWSACDALELGPDGVPRPVLPRSVPRSAEGGELGPEQRARILAHPLVGERLISGDGGTALVLARLGEGAVSIRELEPEVQALSRACEELSMEPVDGSLVSARLTGVPPIRVEIYRTIQREQRLFLVLSAAVCLAVAWALFRSLGATLLVAIPPIVGGVWALGFLGLAGAKIDILGTVLPMIAIVIGFTDCVHLMLDVQGSLAEGRSRARAAGDAIRHLGMACAMTSLTTVVGFGSLAFAEIPIIRRFGLMAAGCVALSFLAVMTVFPLEVLRGGALARRSGRSPRGSAGRRPVELVLRRPGRVAAAGVALCAGLAAISTRLQPDNSLTEALPANSARAEALADLEHAFGGALPVYVVVEWDESLGPASPELLETLERIESALAATERTSKPLSYLALLDAFPNGRADAAAVLELLPEELVRRFVRVDRRRAIVTTSVPDEGSETMVPMFRDIETAVERIAGAHAGIRAGLTGTDPVAREHLNRMILDLARSLAFATVVIFGLIAMEFRSLRLGLISLLPNLFPLVFVAALLVLTGKTLQMSSAMLFSVLLGLAVDDTIHVLARYRRARAAGSPDPVRAAMAKAGRGIVCTTWILGVGFGVIAWSAVPTTQLFAVLTVVGLMAALLGDLVLLPALLVLFGPRSTQSPASASGSGAAEAAAPEP